MTKKYRDPNKIPSANSKCEHVQAIAYVPPADPDDTEIEITSDTSDVKTCQSTATWTYKGQKFCKKHYEQHRTSDSEEYGEYSDPVDLGHDFGD